MVMPMRKAFALALAAGLLALAGCADREPIPPPPWLTPGQVDRDVVGDTPGTDKPAGKTATVTVEGEGITEDSAKQDAARKALEKAAGVIVRNESITVDWQLAQDVVITEARGSIEKMDVLSRRRVAGIHKIKVRAVVSTEMIARDLSILHYLSNNARVACAVADVADGAPAETTLAQNSLERALLSKKFNLVDLSQVEKIKVRDRVKSFNDATAAAALGKRWGCDILITGKGFSAFAEQKTIYGVKQYYYSATIEARAVQVSTGKVIASENITTRRGGSSLDAGRKRALAGAGEDIAVALVKKLVLHLRTTSVDHAQIEVLVKGVDFGKLVALEEELKKIKGMVKVVQRSFRAGTATLACTFKGDTRTLAIHLGRMTAPKLTVQSVERARIEVQVK
jgi:hypothetical protein